MLCVLSIGISDYARRGVNPLDYAHIDARTFADAWASQAGKLYSRVETRVILNKQATVRGIRDGFDWLDQG